jgi:hypothetical protein
MEEPVIDILVTLPIIWDLSTMNVEGERESGRRGCFWTFIKLDAPVPSYLSVTGSKTLQKSGSAAGGRWGKARNRSSAVCTA